MLGHCSITFIFHYCRITQSTIMTDSQKEEMLIDELIMQALEEEASKLEITVDYYMEEFL